MSRPVAEPPGRTELYRFFDARGVLLYVGIAEDIPNRWRQHMREKDWWSEVRRKTTEVYATWDAARKAELAAIAAEYPVHNTADVPPARVFARDLARMLNRKEEDLFKPGTIKLLIELATALNQHFACLAAFSADEQCETPVFGQEPAEGDLHPVRERMRQLLIERGGQGYQAGVLWTTLLAENQVVSRQHMHKWLAADEKAGYVYRTGRPRSRWVWRLGPGDEATAG